MEIHLHSDTEPMNTIENELIDIDVVFRDTVDQSTYDVVIGCGGCSPIDDIVSDFVDLKGYQTGKLEPFTQTSGFSLFPDTERVFNTSSLRQSMCPQKHFTIRLIDYSNRTSPEPIVWAPVVGKAEKFNFKELIEFPLYILSNHGDTWNDLGLTVWISELLGAPLTINVLREMLRRCKVDVLDVFPKEGRVVEIREYFYELALIGFSGAGIEELIHVIYSQSKVPIDYELAIAILVVILIAQGLGILLTVVAWQSMYHRKSKWCTSNPLWAPVEIASGFSMLFLFGSGFFLGPISIMLSGIFRLRELPQCFTKKDVLPNVEPVASSVPIEIVKKTVAVSIQPISIELPTDAKSHKKAPPKGLGFFNQEKPVSCIKNK